MHSSCPVIKAGVSVGRDVSPGEPRDVLCTYLRWQTRWSVD